MGNLLGTITNFLGGGNDTEPSVANQIAYGTFEKESQRDVFGDFNTQRVELLELHDNLRIGIQKLDGDLEGQNNFVRDMTSGGYNSVAAYRKSMQNLELAGGKLGAEQFVGGYGVQGASMRLNSITNTETFQNAYGYSVDRQFDLSKSTVSYGADGTATLVPFVNTTDKDGKPISAAATKDKSRNVDNLNAGGVDLADSLISTDVHFAKFDMAFDRAYNKKSNAIGLTPDARYVDRTKTNMRNTSPIGDNVDFDSMVNQDTPPSGGALGSMDTNPGQGTTVDTNMPTTTAPSIITNDSYTSLNIPLLNDAANITDNPLINKIIDVESSGKPDAVSDHGAKGLMQLKDATADDPGFGVTPAVRNADGSISPEENVRVGTDYFNALTEKYGGDTVLAAMAYNAGPGAIDKWIADGRDFSKLSSETQDYVGKVFGEDVQNQFKDGTYGGTPTASKTKQQEMGTAIFDPNFKYTSTNTPKELMGILYSEFKGTEMTDFIMNGKIPDRLMDPSIKKVAPFTGKDDYKIGDQEGKISFKNGKYTFTTTSLPTPPADTGTGYYNTLANSMAADQKPKIVKKSITKEEANEAGFLVGKAKADAKKDTAQVLESNEKQENSPPVNAIYAKNLKAAAASGDLSKLEELLEKGIEGNTLTERGAEKLQELISKRKNNLFDLSEVQITQVGIGLYSSIPREQRPAFIDAIGYFIQSGGKMDYSERKLALDEATTIARNNASDASNRTEDRLVDDRMRGAATEKRINDITDLAATLDSTNDEYKTNSKTVLNKITLQLEETIAYANQSNFSAQAIKDLNKLKNAQSMAFTKILTQKAAKSGFFASFAQRFGFTEKNPADIAGAMYTNSVGIDKDKNVTNSTKDMVGVRFLKPGSDTQQGKDVYFSSLASGTPGTMNLGAFLARNSGYTAFADDVISTLKTSATINSSLYLAAKKNSGKE